MLCHRSPCLRAADARVVGRPMPGLVTLERFFAIGRPLEGKPTREGKLNGWLLPLLPVSRGRGDLPLGVSPFPPLFFRCGLPILKGGLSEGILSGDTVGLMGPPLSERPPCLVLFCRNSGTDPLGVLAPIERPGVFEEEAGETAGDVEWEGGNGDGWEREASVRLRLEGKREFPGERSEGRSSPLG